MDKNIFIPKQCPERTPLALDIVQGEITEQAARQALKLAPDITSSSIVHDNACGTGPVTSLVASSSTPPQKLHATDIAPVFVQIVAQKAAEDRWDFVGTAVMDARCLDFPDAYFTHSINNFYIQAVPEPHKAMAEIYRTLKPGGTAVVTSWAPVPHVAAIKRANAKTRGEDSPLLMSFKPENYTTAFLIDVIQTAGFEIFESDISEYDCIRRLGGRELGLEEWCAALWGASGQPEGGWTQSDEAKWDEAIAEMVQCFQEHEDVSEHAGCWEVAMRAHIAIVKKGD